MVTVVPKSPFNYKKFAIDVGKCVLVALSLVTFLKVSAIMGHKQELEEAEKARKDAICVAAGGFYDTNYLPPKCFQVIKLDAPQPNDDVVHPRHRDKP